MKFFTSILFVICLATFSNAQSLLDARKGHVTKLVKKESNKVDFPVPPKDLFSVIEYPSKVGKLKACLSIPTDKKKKNPAIIWLTGGFPVGGVGEYVWEKINPKNDQSAQSYRHAGMVMMYPTFRGDQGNPGNIEGYYGEVDDVISAYEYLSKLEYVDKDRIYIGGHSSGATLALLAAAATDKFRGVIAFGPSLDPVEDYSAKYFYHDLEDAKENALRSVITHLDSIKTPTLVIEGDRQYSKVEGLKKAIKNKTIIQSYPREANHFDVIYPINRMIAYDLMEDADAISKYTSEKIDTAFETYTRNTREASDLRTLAYYKERGVKFEEQTVAYYFWTRSERNKDKMKRFTKGSKRSTFEVIEKKDKKGNVYYEMLLKQKVDLNDLDNVFRVSRSANTLACMGNVTYDGWDVEPEEKDEADK